MSFDEDLLHPLTHVTPEAENTVGVLFYSRLFTIVSFLFVVLIRCQGFQNVFLRVTTLHIFRECDRLLNFDVLREYACAPFSFSILDFFHSCIGDLHVLLHLLLPHLLMKLGLELLHHSEILDKPEAVLLACFQSPHGEVFDLARFGRHRGRLIQHDYSFPLHVARIVRELLHFINHQLGPQYLRRMIRVHLCDLSRSLCSALPQRIPINNKICRLKPFERIACFVVRL